MSIFHTSTRGRGVMLFPKASFEWVLFKRTQIAVISKLPQFWNLPISITSIDSLLESETYKRNSQFFLVRKVLESLKTTLSILEPFKTAFLISAPPQTVLVFVFFDSVFFHRFVAGNNIHLEDFHDIYLNDFCLSKIEQLDLMPFDLDSFSWC